MTALLWSTAAAARVQLPSFEPLAVNEDPGGALYLRNGAPMPRIGSSEATRAKQQSAIGRSFRGSAHSLRSALEAAQDDGVWPNVVSIPMAVALCGGRDWALAAAISAERQITLLLQLEDLVSPSSCSRVDGTSVAVAHRIAERHGVSPLAVAARAALQMGHAVHAGRTNSSTPIHVWRRESASRAALSALNFSLTAAEVVQLATGATSTQPPSGVARAPQTSS